MSAQSPEPKAQSPKPKAQSPKPKAQSPKPKAQSPKPRGGVMSESPVPALTLFGEFVSHAVVPPPARAASGGRADGPARPARAV